MLEFKYKSYGLSDIGIEKDVNQDSIFRKNGTYNGTYLVFAVISDGMGGLQAGEVASNIVTNNFENWFMNGGLENALKLEAMSFEEALQEGIDKTLSLSNDEINEFAGEKNILAGTTATMLFLYKGTYYAANIGDSRIYRLSQGKLYQITKDHSWVQQQLDLGRSESEIIRDKDYEQMKNRITRCVGAFTKSINVDYFANDYYEKDMFLLCSDGLIHKITIDEIKEIMIKDISTEEKTKEMISIAKARGETDNISAVLIEVYNNERPKQSKFFRANKDKKNTETSKKEKERITEALK